MPSTESWPSREIGAEYCRRQTVLHRFSALHVALGPVTLHYLAIRFTEDSTGSAAFSVDGLGPASRPDMPREPCQRDLRLDESTGQDLLANRSGYCRGSEFQCDMLTRLQVI